MASHDNNIGFLRLVFASLVIVGHAPEMIDKTQIRAPLHLLGSRSLDLGAVSVSAFFLLSGYLITQSMTRSLSVRAFVFRRALRIYPGYLLAFGLCVFAMGPFVGVDPADGGWGGTLSRLLFLKQPMTYPGQLPGIHGINRLNPPMWTLSHEFQCYLFIAALGAFGLLRPRIVATMTLLSLAAALASPLARPSLATLQHFTMWQLLLVDAQDDPASFLYLYSAFMIGACFCVYREQAAVLLRPVPAILFAASAFATILVGQGFAKLFVLLAATPLFALALKEIEAVSWINGTWDISYGTYLYGWPISICLLWKDPTISPWTLAAATLPLAWLCGAASWWGLERWCKLQNSAEPHTDLLA